jgi:hypothetical protein
MKDVNGLRKKFATVTLSLDLDYTGHSVNRDVSVGQHCASILAQIPAQQCFVVQVLWVEKSSSAKVNEKVRAQMELVYRCPVFFAVGVGDNSLILLEKPLMEKIEIEGARAFYRELNPRKRKAAATHVVVDTFTDGEDVFHIVLERVDGAFTVRPVWPGSGRRVNGFEVRLADFPDLTLEEAALMPATIAMSAFIKDSLQNDTWQFFTLPAMT